MITCRLPECKELAVLWIAVQFDDGDSDISVSCEKHSYDVCLMCIEQHKEVAGNHGAVMGWEPIMFQNLS